MSAGADESAGAEGESMALKYERASKDLIAATNSYNASQADVSRLQREIADYKLQVTDLKSKVVSGEAEVATKAPTGFSLLHLLLAASPAARLLTSVLLATLRLACTPSIFLSIP